MKASECPVSVVSPDARLVIGVFGPAKWGHEATGASLYGMDLMKWPAKAYDIAMAIEQQRNAVEQARFDAESRERKN